MLVFRGFHRPSPSATVLTLAQMAHVVGIRSEVDPVWRLGQRPTVPMLSE